MTAGVRRLPGPVEFVDVGVEVWSKDRQWAGGAQAGPIGGIVVAVTEKGDQETGEVDRAFLVIDPYTTRPYLRWAHLSEREVDRQNLNAPPTNTLWRLWRRCAEAIAYTGPYKRRTGPAVAEEAKLARAIVVLQDAIFGEGGELYAELDPGSPGALAAPRPSYPPAPGAMFVD